VVRRAFVSAVALVGLLAPPAAASEQLRWKNTYGLQITAAAVRTEVDHADPGIGYSRVELLKTGRWTRCWTSAAGVRDAHLIEPGMRELGGPPPLYRPRNPTDRVHHRGRDDEYSGEPDRVLYDSATVEIPADGPGPRWQARCADPLGGTATGHTSDLAGVQAAGSTVTASVNRRTGVYVGVGRAFVAGLETPGGTVDLISSIVRVTAEPGREPTVTYRIGFSGGTLAEGVDVPYRGLGDQFTALAARSTESVSALDSFGLVLVAPAEAPDEFGRPVLHGPFLELSAGPFGGSNLSATRTRLVDVDFRGAYPR
jgi:hypothetical protein